MTKREHIDYISNMPIRQMCELLRFAEPGHPYFNSTLPYWDVFDARFKSLGGWTPELSKSIGWSSAI